MILVNGIQTDTLPVSDRGLHYGDGVFETIAIKQKHPRFLAAHLDRLMRGCSALSIPLPDPDVFESEIALLANTVADKAILKIIMTRGSGGRGYRPETSPHATRILALYPWGDHIEAYRKTGIQLMHCNTQLAHHAQLAGLKHLNRLEQVLASAELADDVQEGLMQDKNGLIIDGTMSNVFIISGDETVKTPRLEQCGIQGIMRNKLFNWLNDKDINTVESDIYIDDILQAKSIVMTNAIIGLWPVNTLKTRQQTRQYAFANFVESFNHYLDTAYTE